MLQHFKCRKAICTKHSDEICISVGLTGVTVLKSNLLHSRFSGSKKLIVNSRGCLQAKEPKPPTKKKPLKSSCNRMYTVNKKRVVNILENYVNAMTTSRSLYFYTITFPISTPDDTAYQCLNSWLTSLRTGYKMVNYLWIAERQKNNTIHFHIAIKEFLPIKEINNLMKKSLHNAIRKGKLPWNHYACSKYNGVDIAKDRITKNVTNFALQGKQSSIAGYMTKYMTKSTEVFKRQAWQSSKSLLAMFTKYNMTYEEFESMMLHTIDHEQPLIESDFYTFYKWRKQVPDEVRFMLRLVNKQALSLNLN